MKRSFSRIRPTLISVLDVGTHKTCCWVAQADGSGFRIVGAGHQATKGYQGGHVKDMAALEASIAGAVHEAERACGETISRVFLNLGGSALKSSMRSGQISVLGKTVTEEDLQRLFLEARLQTDPENYRTLHALPLQYTLDGEKGIENPLGMIGRTLSGSFHCVSIPVSAIQNMLLAVEKAPLEPHALVASAYAAGLSVLTQDERTLGVTVVDIGAGGSAIGVFWGGQIVYTDFVPMGGQHITLDLAQGLETSIMHAERLKVLYGACYGSPKDSGDMIQVLSLTEGARSVPRSVLVEIIAPRVEEILQNIYKKLQNCHLAPLLSQRMVLTGGTSQLPGLRELAQERFHLTVRLGKPQAIPGASGSDRPEFSALSGMLKYTQNEEFQRMAGFLGGKKHTLPFFRQMTSWFKENL
jgi:cell division protein FtsA